MASYFQGIVTHYEVLLPAEILVLLTIGGGIAIWKRWMRPFLDQRFKSYRQSTISSLRIKIALLDYQCADDQRRLRALIVEGLYHIQWFLSIPINIILGILLFSSAHSFGDGYLTTINQISGYIAFAGAFLSSIETSRSHEDFRSLYVPEHYKERFEARLKQLESLG
jgi:hypothetical protein